MPSSDGKGSTTYAEASLHGEYVAPETVANDRRL
jgi:hypothetical protein